MARSATAGLSDLQKDILLSLISRVISRHGVEVVPIPTGEGDGKPLHDLTLLEWRPAEFTGDNTAATKRSTVSASLRKLEDRGLITRRNRNGSLADKGDRRTRYVAFTPEGGRYAAVLYSQTIGDPAEKLRRARIAEITTGLKLLSSTKQLAQMIAEGEVPAEDAKLITLSLDQVADLLESELARMDADAIS